MSGLRKLAFIAVTAIAISAPLLAADLRRPDPYDKWYPSERNYLRSHPPTPNRDFSATVVRNSRGQVTVRNEAGLRLVIANPSIPVVHEGGQYAVSDLQRGDRIRVSFDDGRATRIDVVERGKSPLRRVATPPAQTLLSSEQ